MDMTGPGTEKYTLNDIEVGSRLYEALVQHARATQGSMIFYSDLLVLAKSMFAADAVLGRAVPVGIGMKLLFVETFCRMHGYLNLACLAVNRALGRPGPGYTGDWENEKREVAAFDWSTAEAYLPVYVQAAREALPRERIPRRTDAAARVLRWEYFSANREMYASLNGADAEEVVNLLMEGITVEDAFRQVLADKALFGEEG